MVKVQQVGQVVLSDYSDKKEFTLTLKEWKWDRIVMLLEREAMAIAATYNIPPHTTGAHAILWGVQRQMKEA